MSEEITIVLPATFKATGSNQTIDINPADWGENAQAHTEYLLTYAAGVIMQRASANKNDDPEKAAKAVEAAIERLKKGVVPAGGGFTKLSPEEYAMKEALTNAKVKFESGEKVTDVLYRLADKLTEIDLPEGAESHADVYEEDEDYTAAYDQAVEATHEALVAELEASEVYKSALKARKAKAKSAAATGSLLSKATS